MRVKNLKKIFTPFLIISLFSQTALLLSPREASAQASIGAGGSVQTGFDANGIAGSALVCSGVADKLAGAINSLFSSSTSVVTQTVPVDNPAENLRDSCLKQITRTILNKILDKITLSTVDWINHGFDKDGPLWLEDSEQFFGDIARNEINATTGWLTCNGSVNCDNYKFGRLVMTQILLDLQRTTQQNMQFSLNQVLTHGTYEEFRFDFNVGGWAGYTAFLEPQNNPFGNYILVNDDIGRRIGGTSINVAGRFHNQLTESGGYLSPRVCVLSGNGQDDYIPDKGPGSDMHLAEFYQVLPTGSTLGDVTFAQLPPAVQSYLSGFTDPVEQASEYNFIVLRSRCARWKTTTPGQVVGSRLTQGLDNATNQLLSADDLAENIGLIFDALLNQLIQYGLRRLSSDNQDSVPLAQVNGQQPGAVANGQTPPPATDTILGTGPINIASMPLVDVQNDYITQSQSALALLDELTKKIRALDYCVPGPNPRWLDAATSNFQQAIANVAPASTSTPTTANQMYYKSIIHDMTGVFITDDSLAMYNHTQFMAFMQEVFNRYRDRMLANYSPTNAPPATRFFLTQLFNDLDIYNAETTDLTNYLANIASIMPTVIQLQDTLQALADANNGVLDTTDPNVQAQISIFNSISSHLATQTQLNTLVARQLVYQTQIAVLDTHFTNCVQEVTNNYQHPNARISYPGQLFPYPGLSILSSGQSFLPGVGFGGGGNNIDVQINGVQVFIPSQGLSDFEGILQSIY